MPLVAGLGAADFGWSLGLLCAVSMRVKSEVGELGTYAIRSPNPLIGAAAAFEALTTISTWRCVSNFAGRVRKNAVPSLDVYLLERR